MKYFISSDIHGFYDEYQKSLLEKGFDINNKSHIIVILGDLFDRGHKHRELIDFILNLPEERTLLVTGNHEDLMDDLVNRGYCFMHDIQNGTYATLQELCNLSIYEDSFDSDNVKKILEKVGYYDIRKRMKDYHEVGDHIFVHGWIPCYNYGYIHIYNHNWRNSTHSEWKEARWLNGMDMWRFGIKEPNKTIYCGHWNCSYGWSKIRQKRKEFPNKNKKDFLKSFEPFIDDGICAIDSCVAYSGHINVVTLEL